MGPAPKPITERLLERSIPEPNSGCWLWLGVPKTKQGYGHIEIAKCTWMAHRASWAAFNGPIPPGLFVLHKCDVGACINPEHLFLGTACDNMRDCVTKGRNRRNYIRHDLCARGHPLDQKNLYLGSHGRCCRKCLTDRQRERRQRQKLESWIERGASIRR